MFFSKIYIVLFCIFITVQCVTSSPWFKFNLFGSKSSEIENAGSSTEPEEDCNAVAVTSDAKEIAECRKNLNDQQYVKQLRLRVSKVGKEALMSLMNETKIKEVATSSKFAVSFLKNLDNMPMVCKEKTGPIVKAAFESYFNLLMKYDSSVLRTFSEVSQRISYFTISTFEDCVDDLRYILNEARYPLSAESRKKIEDGFLKVRTEVEKNLYGVNDALKQVHVFRDEAMRTLGVIEEAATAVRILTSEESDNFMMKFGETENYKNVRFNIDGVHVPIADVYFGKASLFTNDRERDKEHCLFCAITSSDSENSFKFNYYFEPMMIAKQFMEGIAELDNLSVDCVKFNELLRDQEIGLEAMQMVVDKVVDGRVPRDEEYIHDYEFGLDRLVVYVREYDELLSRVLKAMENCIF